MGGDRRDGALGLVKGDREGVSKGMECSTREITQRKGGEGRSTG